jgi:hypothetical protein
MDFLIYTILMMAFSLTLCLFGFFVGRCARKLPILDENLPWTLHRAHISFEDCQATREQGQNRLTGHGTSH